ncbi:amidohydrolase [Naumannella halotolerans]|uniref:amidohydrolase n=1 Tax=Naumannella halotolerans TaxID=993414 RepID=UPI00370D6B67
MVDLIVHGAQLRTMTPESNPAQTALAVRGGRIVDIGSDAEVLATAGPHTRVIDAAGRTVTPGLIDAHCHPVWGAELTVGVDLGGLDLAGVRQALAAAAAQLGPEEWVRGWNLDYKVFDGPITGELFDEAIGSRPLVMIFFDLHTAVANSRALALAGMDGREVFDAASTVVVDADGRPTGELQEMPAYLRLLEAAPVLPRSEVARLTRSELQKMAAPGVTTTTIMDGREDTLEVLAEIEEADQLPVRLVVAMWHEPGDDDAQLARRQGLLGSGGQHWQVSMIKIFLDGVIDSGTAWLHAPDTAGGSRVPFWDSLDRYAEVVDDYHSAGWQIATHSCGDAGVAEAAKVYSRLGAPKGGGAHRVEHLETLTDDDLAAVAESGLIASMQPLHMQWREADHADSWAIRLGPERAAHGFRVQDLLRAGARVALGSDWPVAQNDARLGMAWARLRRLPGSPQAPVFEADQCLSGEQALSGYTRWAAPAVGRDDLGTIVVGATADLMLWADDPVTTDPDRLPELDVAMTIIEGRIVHLSPQFD